MSILSCKWEKVDLRQKPIHINRVTEARDRLHGKRYMVGFSPFFVPELSVELFEISDMIICTLYLIWHLIYVSDDKNQKITSD